MDNSTKNDNYEIIPYEIMKPKVKILTSFNGINKRLTFLSVLFSFDI